MKKSVLITGATGGLGLALTQTFADAGYSVTATGRSLRHAKRFHDMGVQFISADLTKAETMPGLCYHQDAVIHAAALSSSWGKFEDFHRINVTATKNLCSAAQHAGVKDFIFISSPSIMTRMEDQIRQKECPIGKHTPLNDYAKTKLEAERYILAQDSINFRTAALRPRALIGPDDQVLLPQIMTLVRKGRLPLLRGGQACVDLTDTRDAARAALLALKNIDSAHGKFFHISGGVGVNMKDLTTDIAKICGVNIGFFNCPITLAKIIAYTLEKTAVLIQAKSEPALTRYKLATLAYSQTFDLTAAVAHLGYKPLYDARETLLNLLKDKNHAAA